MKNDLKWKSNSFNRFPKFSEHITNKPDINILKICDITNKWTKSDELGS